MSGFDWNRLGARPRNTSTVKRGGRQAKELSRAYAQSCTATAATAASAAETPTPISSSSFQHSSCL